MTRFIIAIFSVFLAAAAALSSAPAQIGPPSAPSPVGPPLAHPPADNVQAAFEKQLLTPLFTPAVDYNSFPRMDKCRDEVPRRLRYHNCRDSHAIYDAGLKAARDANKPLVIFFGFNKCPYCAVLERQIFDPKRPLRDGNLVRYFSAEAIEDYGRKAAPLKLPYINIHARSPHGLKLADDIGVSALAKARGWHRVWSPFVVFVDPKTERLVSQNYWEAPETHCDPIADFAVNLEELGVIKPGEPVSERKRCQRKS